MNLTTTRIVATLAVAIAALVGAVPALGAPGGNASPSDRVEVKFREGTSVRVRGDGLVTLGRDDLSQVRDVLRQFPGVRIERLFSRPEVELAREKKEIEAESGRELADLNLYFSIVTRGNGESDDLAAALARLPIVESAYVSPEPAPAPATADFTGSQWYRGTAPSGIDVSAAAAYRGGKGDFVRVADLEYSWNVNHEDLSKARLAGAFIASGPSPSDPFADHNHGTAVIGELSADDNGFGVTGLVPNATLRMVNTNDATQGYVLANAIDVARANMSPGDVMLIEQQATGANGGCDRTGQTGCVAVEWINSVYDAIVRATAAGMIVVEAAGNGRQNLDAPEYGSPFPKGKADSGAIIVGAGGAPGCSTYPRSRLSFSSYGSRVNLQGWGECVTTTGYGGLFNPGYANGWYTSSFSGTSSASPIVAAAAASLSSTYEAATGKNLTPTQVRSILVRTGTPQVTNTATPSGNIGPLPDLARALQETIDTTPPAMGAVVEQIDVPNRVTSTTVPVKIAWSASDPSGVTAYDVWMSTNNGAYAQVAGGTADRQRVFSLSTGSTYKLAVRAKDAFGNWSAYAYSHPLTVRVGDEKALALPSGWQRYSWTSAFGGTATTSSTANATLTYSFTGRDVALVAPTFSTAGRAKVYCDGTYYGMVDLYASSLTAMNTVFWCRFAASTTHTMKVVVEGTSGRPRFDVDAFAVLS